MTLKKAIEILQAMTHHPWSRDYPDHRDAIKLGIEAGKFVQQLRTSIPLGLEHKLPGETEE